MSDKEFHINKNYQYLFKQHSSRLNNSNKYKKKTILINIDNYDVGEENDLIYDSKIYISKYYKNIYNYIDILHINLDSLRNKIYNKSELDSIDRLLLIFVEQDKRNLIGIVEREVINIMDYMARLDFKEGDPVTYNYLEAEKVRKEMWEEKVEKWNKKMKQDKKNLEQNKQELEQNKQELEQNKQELEQNKQELEEEKISLAKALKAEGYPTNKILKITKLSKNIIMML